ncbi:uncharacterized protein LOC135371193 [Ornithodoros turicata]|uniref:uncharacterized protein LOC135371193 n=1 Tax=Ornithodoros turicata TaxID=34597 RepID=UPI00313A44B6
MSCRCWNTEEEGAPCLVMTDAPLGKCFRGECYNLLSYDSLTKGQQQNPGWQCTKASDYLLWAGKVFGCKYHCDSKPYHIVNRPDGHFCLVPSEAPPGICKGDSCKRI